MKEEKRSSAERKEVGGMRTTGLLTLLYGLLWVVSRIFVFE